MKAVTLSQKAVYAATTLRGAVSPHMICPHWVENGNVHTKPVTKKAGISGGMATGALVTGGIPILATGLSRKESLTAAFCRN